MTTTNTSTTAVPMARWWPVIPPGMTRHQAERLTALACAIRILGVTAEDTGWTTRSNRAETAAENLADWLHDAETDDEARIRRYLLLLSADLTVPGTDTGWREVRETAKWMIAFARRD